MEDIKSGIVTHISITSLYDNLLVQYNRLWRIFF